MLRDCHIKVRLNRIKEVAYKLKYHWGDKYGKNIKTTVNLMTKQGFNIKDIVIFNNMRHDILHEKDNIKVLDYIYEAITH